MKCDQVDCAAEAVAEVIMNIDKKKIIGRVCYRHAQILKWGYGLR